MDTKDLGISYHYFEFLKSNSKVALNKISSFPALYIFNQTLPICPFQPFPAQLTTETDVLNLSANPTHIQRQLLLKNTGSEDLFPERGFEILLP